MALFYRPHIWDGLKNKPKKKKKKSRHANSRGNIQKEYCGQFDDISQIPDLPPSYDEVNKQNNDNISTQFVHPGGNAQPHPPNKYQPEATEVSAKQKMKLSKTPCQLICPHCSTHITTKVDYVTNKSTYVLATLLCLFGCWPCCLFACCSSNLKDIKHQCPTCHTEVGIVKQK